ncbi:hypothetical protein QE441_003024 [Chryseobacterium sp. SORGH_AS909]|uniref:Uncharacterized protein n=1 Tax=Chryseobacterium camelliae TaxID=1265445 RepID=A0ABU0TFV7_9FLAO|nr:hypothetical protein [Chryseobacterium camelliae]MDQ1099884.1 hypothetical protein [Chryseobacterium sp. SORGH_AS_1048]MDR6087230.1 hypothetical protein [Chryseobacterium sp. SORGH_AS_0909]MDR6131604.1 hypothetical protein [Chryseobacterium sp. SORGH_AS_1175]MDT3406253.1 hypothetical protein [Pseudacidovorax intermedius]
MVKKYREDSPKMLFPGMIQLFIYNSFREITFT